MSVGNISAQYQYNIGEQSQFLILVCNISAIIGVQNISVQYQFNIGALTL